MAATKPHATLEKWTWILIYGGLFILILGIATGRREASLGWAMAVPGAVLAAVGIVLIYVRSRLPDTPNISTKETR
jgi:glucan phosphoethanolaminetransferase (alkaline phosphatase superfamily)